MRHFASPSFWKSFGEIPPRSQSVARKSFALLKENPDYPSLHLKRAGRFWSARVGLRYRALAVTVDDDLLWFWIGTHAQYDRLIQER